MKTSFIKIYIFNGLDIYDLNIYYNKYLMEQKCDIWSGMYIFLKKQDKTTIIIDEKINELIKMLEDNLKEYCQHEMEEDYIDISVDTCKKIYYCKKCLLTFNIR